jgi:hypothetical protein
MVGAALARRLRDDRPADDDQAAADRDRQGRGGAKRQALDERGSAMIRFLSRKPSISIPLRLGCP